MFCNASLKQNILNIHYTTVSDHSLKRGKQHCLLYYKIREIEYGSFFYLYSELLHSSVAIK